MTAIYGYFDSATQQHPRFDPGLSVYCPVCAGPLSMPIKTISLMYLPNDGRQPDRSYFYRAHKQCYDALDDAGKRRIDGLIIDAVAASRNVN